MERADRQELGPYKRSAADINGIQIKKGLGRESEPVFFPPYTLHSLVFRYTSNASVWPNLTSSFRGSLGCSVLQISLL